MHLSRLKILTKAGFTLSPFKSPSEQKKKSLPKSITNEKLSKDYKHINN